MANHDGPNGVSGRDDEWAPRDSHAESLIVQAHEFFRLQILEWIDESYEGTDRDTRIHALETALLGLLELVVIDLGSDDNAYLIFETLNARGTPLLASDLIKNFFCVQRASRP